MIIPSSERWGVGSEYGKYAVKIYTIDGVLIYQVDIGTTNSGKTPLGGIILQSLVSSSMATTITNPITFYGGNSSVINQSGHSGDLYNYYWTSYSRGTDGSSTTTQWHNAYLDGYIPLRVKSIYDPCPYLYRIPSNGTFNQFNMQTGWTSWSYLGGVSWNMNALGESWLSDLGSRNFGSGNFYYLGGASFYRSSTASSQTNSYILDFNSSKGLYVNQTGYHRAFGHSVRCIEDCDPRADGTPASAGY